MTLPVVAVDGPAGAGKSTVARAVARALGMEVLDTGAMYRAVTLAVLQRGVDPADATAVAEVARGVRIEVGERVVLDGVDATEAIREPDVNAAVSEVSAQPDVRVEMVRRQREWVQAHGGGVVEGRDIGTVVSPDAPVKVFLTADTGVRASRRLEEERAALERRDRFDSTRPVAPLQPAEDAVVIDTTELSVEDVVAKVLDEAREVGLLA